VIVDIHIDPTIVEIGRLQLTWHGLISALAILIAAQIGLALARRQGLPEPALLRMIWWAVPGGVIGARIFHVLDHLDTYTADPLRILYIWQGGLAIYGGLIGGVLTALVVMRIEGLPAWTVLDVAAPALLIGQALGRIGCFINGDTIGEPTGENWGVAYHHPDAIVPRDLLGVATHPYPLYEMAWNLGVVALIVLLLPRLRRRGDIFLIATLGYALGRFTLTFFRQEPIVAFGLQEAQIIAILTAVLVAVLFIITRRPAITNSPTTP
jgi:phosphatidylglycerol---prolipoprotein diacylglyceryl transferase